MRPVRNAPENPMPDGRGGAELVTDIDQVARRVRAIRDAAGDDEIAHGLEDKLWMDVLATIATQTGPDGPMSAFEAGQLCGAALRTRHIDFRRWTS